jgi:SSS family solute:Na+ symporter
VRPNTPERVQVFLGRMSIVVATVLGVAAAYLVYKTEEGLYKDLQTISIYLVMPILAAPGAITVLAYWWLW